MYSDWLCVEVENPCPTTVINSVNIPQTITVNLDDTEVFDLLAHNFPWTNTVGVQADVNGCGARFREIDAHIN